MKEQAFRSKAVLSIAQEICLAARTAPKGKGVDLLEIAILTNDEIKSLSAKMLEIGKREAHPTFLRDGENVLSAQAVVILGTKRQTLGLRFCGFCGYPNCAEAQKNNAVCVYNPGDLGIAIGSAVSVAMDHRVDNRVMYTIGKAVIEMGLLDKDVSIAFGIPLSVSAKNPFFDR